MSCLIKNRFLVNPQNLFTHFIVEKHSTSAKTCVKTFHSLKTSASKRSDLSHFNAHLYSARIDHLQFDGSILSSCLHTLSKLRISGRAPGNVGNNTPVATKSTSGIKNDDSVSTTSVENAVKSTSPEASHSVEGREKEPQSGDKPELRIPLGQKLCIVFTCKVCSTRSSKLFSKHSYEKGIVIVRCPGCENLHLIADNLGWFKHFEHRNVEEMLMAKGEQVKKFTDIDGTLELISEDAKETLQKLPNSDRDKWCHTAQLSLS